MGSAIEKAYVRPIGKGAEQEVTEGILGSMRNDMGLTSSPDDMELII